MDLSVWAPNASVAEGACATALAEIDRLASILDTRRPDSAISRYERAGGKVAAPPELQAVLKAYARWEHRTGGVFTMRPRGADAPRDIDALGKAYIIDRAAAALREAWPSVDGLLLNIGGDAVVSGTACEIAIADPDHAYDNARPVATVRIRNAAIATSGTYARGAHLVDGRGGRGTGNAAATVVAPDVVTANALATTLCLIEADRGMQLVEATPDAEALRCSSGDVRRSSGFAILEERYKPGTDVNAAWPNGYQFSVTVPLTPGRSKKRPYVSVWIEDSEGNLVRPLAFWGSQSKYQPHLPTIWTLMTRGHIPIRSVSRATRAVGKYDFVWDGFDLNQKPVPPGTYRVTVETNQEHGSYAKQSGLITLGDAPETITLSATANFDKVVVQYGPK